MTDDNVVRHLANEWARARKLRADAEEEARVGLHDRAASTLSFAAVHACRALLASDGIEPRSHRGLSSLVSLHFVKAGRIDASVTRGLVELQDAREGSDYIATYVVSAEEYERLERVADAILGEVQRVLSSRADPVP